MPSQAAIDRTEAKRAELRAAADARHAALKAQQAAQKAAANQARQAPAGTATVSERPTYGRDSYDAEANDVTDGLETPADMPPQQSVTPLLLIGAGVAALYYMQRKKRRG